MLTRPILVCLALAAGSQAADAAYLQWSKFPVRTQSETTCLRLARDVAQRKGLQNLRVNALEVSGTRGSAYVSITCVGRGGGAQAIGMVIVVSDDNGAAVSTRDDVAAALKGITLID